MDKHKSERGFTLLEVLLAAGIMGLLTMAIFRFVQTNITVVQISAAENADDARYTGLLGLLTTQWQSLPTGVGALTGDTFKFSDRQRDEITWVSSAGPGLLTRYAAGEFTARMRLRPMKEGSDKLQLGIYRKPRGDAEGSNEGETWVPLLDDVNGLRIHYFDARLNAWVERWTDTGTLPKLIELVLERSNRPNWRAVVAISRTPF
jgi:prepilin-type N-terminal cleavage/methylation domain-containing protein